MPTNRKPIVRRRHGAKLTPEVLTAFRRLRAAEKACTCTPMDWGGEYWKHKPCEACGRWWEAHSVIQAELKLPPWEWPAVENPETKNPYPKGSFAADRWQPNGRATSLYCELQAAAGEVAHA